MLTSSMLPVVIDPCAPNSELSTLDSPSLLPIPFRSAHIQLKTNSFKSSRFRTYAMGASR